MKKVVDSSLKMLVESLGVEYDSLSIRQRDNLAKAFGKATRMLEMVEDYDPLDDLNDWDTELIDDELLDTGLEYEPAGEDAMGLVDHSVSLDDLSHEDELLDLYSDDAYEHYSSLGDDDLFENMSISSLLEMDLDFFGEDDFDDIVSDVETETAAKELEKDAKRKEIERKYKLSSKPSPEDLESAADEFLGDDSKLKSRRAHSLHDDELEDDGMGGVSAKRRRLSVDDDLEDAIWDDVGDDTEGDLIDAVDSEATAGEWRMRFGEYEESEDEFGYEDEDEPSDEIDASGFDLSPDEDFDVDDDSDDRLSAEELDALVAALDDEEDTDEDSDR